MKDNNNWPEEYPDADKKKVASRKGSAALTVWSAGIIVGVLLGFSISYLLRDGGSTYGPAFTETLDAPSVSATDILPTIPLRPTATPLRPWTVEAAAVPTVVRPTATPWLVQGNAGALLTVYFHQEDFLNVTGATQKLFFPEPVPFTDMPYHENGLEIASPNQSIAVDKYAELIEGYELKVAGPEHVTVTFPEPITAFGWQMQDGFAESQYAGEASCYQQDSKFVWIFFAGDEEIGRLPRWPSPGYLSFMGFSSSQPFDRLEVREEALIVAQEEGDYCEHDFLGPIWTD